MHNYEFSNLHCSVATLFENLHCLCCYSTRTLRRLLADLGLTKTKNYDDNEVIAAVRVSSMITQQ